jgi:signal recognition particle receptor subunit beta
MALFNYATRELSAKIVYYGPGLSGKTTNIEMVHKMLRPEQKGRLISLPTETDRTLFFDFLPIELGQIKGFKVRFHLYTVPGQVFYNATRRLVLQGVDGVVFVADSQREMTNGNLESMKNLMDNLSSYGKKFEDLPFVIQYNKRDLRNAAPVAELDAVLNFLRAPIFEAVAPTGKGVTETLVGISRMVFSHLRKTLLMPGEMAAHEDIGDLADARIRKTFTAQAMEPLEEISDIEEIREGEEPLPEVSAAPPQGAVAEPPRPTIEAPPEAAVEESPQAAVGEVDLESTSLRSSEPAPPAEFEELSEIEVEIPEKEPAPQPPSVAMSVEVEGSGLSFLRFEAPFVSPEGHAILPALFLDGAGNPVRLRIRVTMEGE